MGFDVLTDLVCKVLLSDLVAYRAPMNFRAHRLSGYQFLLQTGLIG
jgi:hypothetical protein